MQQLQAGYPDWDRCESLSRIQIAFKALPSRYTKNKVLFSVPCVYAREAFFSKLFRPWHASQDIEPARDGADVLGWIPGLKPVWSPSRIHIQIAFKANPQSTLKTRYFLVYLVCMRVNRFFRGCFVLGMLHKALNLRGMMQQMQAGYPDWDRCESLSRIQIAFKALPSRYTKNKVLFSVPCAYARETML